MQNIGELTDSQLTLLLKKGDIAAFDEVYNRYSVSLYKFAFTILKDEDECTDIIQDLFIWLWENKEIMDIKAIKPYLFAATKFNLARFIRNSKRRAEILNTIPNLEFTDDQELELKELKTLIKSFVDGLPQRARDIFELSRFQYKSNKEIAEELNLSKKTVENQITICLKKLRIHLGKNSFLTFFV